jgi:hypothetical protein
MQHYINLTEVPERHRESCWRLTQRRLVRILKRTHHPHLGRACVSLTIRRDGRIPAGWEVRLRIRLGRDLLTVRVSGVDRPLPGLRRAFDQLEHRLRKQLRSRHDRRRVLCARRSATRRQLEAGLQSLEDPVRVLQGLTGFLRRLAGEALRAMEEDDPQQWCPLGPDDLADETLLRALDSWDRRPVSGQLEVWLSSILGSILAEESDRFSQEEVGTSDETSIAEDEEDPRRDTLRWLDASRDPVGLALWDDRETPPRKTRRVA